MAELLPSLMRASLSTVAEGDDESTQSKSMSLSLSLPPLDRAYNAHTLTCALGERALRRQTSALLQREGSFSELPLLEDEDADEEEDAEDEAWVMHARLRRTESMKMSSASPKGLQRSRSTLLMAKKTERETQESNAQESAWNSPDKTTSARPKVPKIYEIDYVGNGTFRTPQQHIFNKRSVEIMKTADGALSARGLHHRPREVFEKEVQHYSHIISGLMRGEKVTSQKNKPSAALFYPYFQRALAQERLGNLSRAITDFSVCIRANPLSAAAFFNRASLYKARREFEKAIDDMNQAIHIEPANIEFRNFRAQLLRETNYYAEAMKDTVLSKALENQPSIARTLIESHARESETGDDIRIDADLLFVRKLAEDPVLVSLAIPPEDRSPKQLEPIVDFLRSLKFFHGFANNLSALRTIASKVVMRAYSRDDVIFQEGDPGHHFYIVLDGEVSIVKVKPLYEDVTETIVLVKMFRGQTFGETAIESKGGLRTAGAIASHTTKLLVLGAEEYQLILSKFRNLLKEEVKLVLKHSPLFHDWEESKLDYLASYAIVKSFKANTEIMKANEPVKDLIVIKSGIVQLIKPIPKPGLLSIKKNAEVSRGLIINDGFDESPGLWILQKSWNTHLDEQLREKYAPDVEQAEFTVAILGSGQMFGELSVLDPHQNSALYARTATSVECYCLESDVLLAAGARYNATTLKALRESLTLNDPPADKIGYYFRSKYSWELRKDKLIRRLKAGKL